MLRVLDLQQGELGLHRRLWFSTSNMIPFLPCLQWRLPAAGTPRDILALQMQSFLGAACLFPAAPMSTTLIHCDCPQPRSTPQTCTIPSGQYSYPFSLRHLSDFCTWDDLVQGIEEHDQAWLNIFASREVLESHTKGREISFFSLLYQVIYFPVRYILLCTERSLK